MYKIYGFMAGISLLVRQFFLPNPFEKLPQPVMAELGGVTIAIPTLVINVVAEPILHTITFAVVGIYYTRGEFPAWGSFLYLVFYAVHIGLLTLMAITQFATWAIILIIILYFVCHIALLSLVNHRSAA